VGHHFRTSRSSLGELVPDLFLGWYALWIRTHPPDGTRQTLASPVSASTRIQLWIGRVSIQSMPFVKKKDKR